MIDTEEYMKEANKVLCDFIPELDEFVGENLGDLITNLLLEVGRLREEVNVLTKLSTIARKYVGHHLIETEMKKMELIE